MTGPIERPAGVLAAALVRLEDNSRRVLCLATNGDLYFEDLGYNENGAALSYSFKTAKVYPVERGQSLRILRSGMHVTSETTSAYLPTVVLGSQGTPLMWQEEHNLPQGDELLLYPASGPAEYVQVGASGTCCDVAFNGFYLRGEERGQAPRVST